MSTDNGATPETVDPAKFQECQGSGDGRTMAHAWAWISDVSMEVKCMRCGKVESRETNRRQHD